MKLNVNVCLVEQLNISFLFLFCFGNVGVEGRETLICSLDRAAPPSVSLFCLPPMWHYDELRQPRTKVSASSADDSAAAPWCSISVEPVGINERRKIMRGPISRCRKLLFVKQLFHLRILFTCEIQQRAGLLTIFTFNWGLCLTLGLNNRIALD